MLILKKVVEAFGWEALIEWRAKTLRTKIQKYREIKEELRFHDTQKTLSLFMKHRGKATDLSIQDDATEFELKYRLSAIEQEIKVLRRNRAMVRQIGKKFADYIQAEFNIPCDALLMAFPEWYTPNRHVPYKFLTYGIQTFQAITPVDSEFVPVTETIKHEVTVIPFGNVSGMRIYAGYHSETYTVYLGEMYHKDDRLDRRF